ncbi:MAG: carbohydrate kinase [Synergistaceae bacterium]|nr:carbohydrate kinase [Synergistaceae bacterium]
MRYYLGVDNGGTTTKAALFDENGREIASAATGTAMITPKSGFTERDMEEMWRANCSVIRQVLDKSGCRPQQVAAVAICGHGKGLYLWGKNGKPVRPGVISTDNRAWRYVQRWKENGVEARAFPISLQHVMACQPVALLAWLKDNEPESYAGIGWIFECKDYVRFRLTGEALAEITDYSGTGLLNLRTREYDRHLLELFGIEEILEALPPLCGSADVCGRVTREAAEACGLMEGTPVAGGMFDIDACALATGVVDPQNICMIAGTWSINEYLRSEPVTDGRVLMNSLFCLPEYYLIEESSPTSAGNNEWFARQLLPEIAAEEEKAGRSVFGLLERWVDGIPPETFCPVFLPFLLASNVHPNAKGSFVGLGNFHTRAHLARSVWEGITFSHKYHLDKLLATRGEPPRAIRLSGGATRSKVWTQMFADCTGLPVETVTANETGALGCAVAASVAVGDRASLAEAANAMCSIAPAVLPRPEHRDAYAQKYSLYLRLIEALDPVWPEMQALAEKSI